MITSFNTPVRELDGHIFVEAEELYKRDEIIEQLKKELQEEKQAYIRMYNRYAEEKECVEKLNKIIAHALGYIECANEVDITYVCKILIGSDKE